MISSRLAALVPFLLSFNAGFVDTAGFLALQGLFSAHVTGNFVTLGASLVMGSSGATAKLLALPVFCVVVVATRLLNSALLRRNLPALTTLLLLKVMLLITAAALAMRFGPFGNGDAWQAILTGMVLVAAMSIQNAVHRIHLASAPPSTLMTGTTTQIMIDLADTLQRPAGGVPATPASRSLIMIANVAIFALGCAAAAVLYVHFGVRSFLVPPVMALVTLLVRTRIPAPG